MATYRENLETRRDAVAAELAALDATKAGGLPNSQAGGIDHATYKRDLLAELRQLNEMIATAIDAEETSAMTFTQGYPL